MLPESESQPLTLPQRVVAEFRLMPSSSTWMIAADRLEEESGNAVTPNAWRCGLWIIDGNNNGDGAVAGDGDGSGYGSGNGYGNGHGYGHEDGSGHGDGHGDGNGYGNGHGYGHGDGDGSGNGNG